MKIANLILTSQNGGAEQVFLDYCSIFKSLGHEVVAIVKNNAPYAHELTKIGIEPKKISNRFGYHDVIAVNKLKKILQDNDIDAIFAHAGRSMVIARKAIKKIKNKKIFLIAVNHSMNVKRSIDSDLIISVNKPIFFKTIDAGKKENESFVIPNAIDLSDAIESVTEIDLTKKDQIIIGAIGRLDEAKGFHFVIRALKKLKEFSDKKIILKIAGEGPRKKFLTNLAKDLGLEDRVEFLGWINDKKKFFTSIDIFTLSSKRETFGLVLLEAMKYRRPIISTTADGPCEILRGEEDALLVKLDEDEEMIVDRFVDAIMRLISEENLANFLVKNSSRRLREKFSKEALKKRMQEIVGIFS